MEFPAKRFEAAEWRVWTHTRMPHCHCSAVKTHNFGLDGHNFKLAYRRDFKIKPDIVNLIKQKVRNSLELIDIGDNFLIRTPIAQTWRSTTDQWELIKLQSFCKAKDTVNRTKWQPTDSEKIFINPTSNRGLTSKIYKELKKLDSREPNNSI